MRKITQDQFKGQHRPVVGFLPRVPAYVVKNFSNNLALNLFCFSKRGQNYFMVPSSNHIIAILSAQQDTGDLYQKNGFNQEVKISKNQLEKQFPWVRPLIKRLELENDITRLIICYEDIFKNKLYTLINSSGGSYEEVGETGYIIDLK